MSSTRQPRNLALVGFMGTGKSTIGRELATELGFGFLDTDQSIEERAQASISDIFKNQGEAGFRKLEQELVNELKSTEKLVIATGGGLVCQPETLEALRRCSFLVCLWATPEVIWERVRIHQHRPLLQGPDPLGKIRELLQSREKFYRQADLLINTDSRPVKELVQIISHQFQRAHSPGSETR